MGQRGEEDAGVAAAWRSLDLWAAVFAVVTLGFAALVVVAIARDHPGGWVLGTPAVLLSGYIAWRMVEMRTGRRLESTPPASSILAYRRSPGSVGFLRRWLVVVATPESVSVRSARLSPGERVFKLSIDELELPLERVSTGHIALRSATAGEAYEIKGMHPLSVAALDEFLTDAHPA